MAVRRSVLANLISIGRLELSFNLGLHLQVANGQSGTSAPVFGSASTFGAGSGFAGFKVRAADPGLECQLELHERQ